MAAEKIEKRLEKEAERIMTEKLQEFREEYDNWRCFMETEYGEEVPPATDIALAMMALDIAIKDYRGLNRWNKESNK